MQRATLGDTKRDQLYDECSRLLSARPLIVGSNRGPLEFHLNPDGELQARRGSGAVVTALSSLIKSFEFTWVASAMGEGDRKAELLADGQAIRSPLPNQQVSVRYVVTPRRMYHKFYNILCNPLLWFLQHQMWSAPYTPNVDESVHDAWENGYRPVNQAFADAILAEASRHDSAPIVVLHDYHLYLTAGMVKRNLPDALIYHFIQIPWPSPDQWQLLPIGMRQAICSSLCSADLIGFQSTWDVHSFLESCRRFLDGALVDYETCSININGHQTRVRAYPTSIDVEEVQRIATSPRVLDYDQMVESLCAEHTILRVDRTEPSKNIVRGFRAYQLFLQQHPELHGRVTFVAFLVPSRTHVKQYERYQEEINSIARNVNDQFGTNEWRPIQVFYGNNYAQALAGMRRYDALLVNPLGDGMSLVAKEGPVVNTRNGVLILSEGTGAHEQLKLGALTVAPADLLGTAQAFHDAVTMPMEERVRRANVLFSTVEREDATHWLSSQVEELLSLL